MAWNFEYPYVDSKHYNDDWLIKTIKEVVKQLEEFVNLNKIKYANPIGWDITRQYEANTVVVDNRTGNAYISSRPVPSGIQIDNTEYWTEIYNYANVIHILREQIATDEGNNTTASKEYSVDDLVFVSGLLYKVISPMIAGDSFVPDSNIKKITIEDLIAYLFSLIGTINNNIGNLSDLDTRIVSTIVGAINSVNADRINGDTAITEQINAISKRVSIFDQRRIIVIGDSYLYGVNVDGDERIASWGDYLKSYLGIADDDFFKVDIDGGGFVSNGTDDKNWLLQLQARSASITSHDTITDIVVLGGQNDKSVTTVTLAAAVASFCSYVKSEYPNARLHIGYCGVDYLNMQTQLNAIATIPVYEDCVISGASYIYGAEYILRDTSLLQSDHCHPTPDGQKELAKYLVNYLGHNMNYGCKSLFRRQTPTFTPDTGVTGALTFNILKNNGNTEIDAYFGQGITIATSNQNWDGTHRIKLGELSDSALWGFSFAGANTQNPTTMVCPALFVIGGQYYKGDLNLHIQAKSVFGAPFIQTIEGAYMSGIITTIIPAQTSHTVVNSLLC